MNRVYNEIKELVLYKKKNRHKEKCDSSNYFKGQ